MEQNKETSKFKTIGIWALVLVGMAVVYVFGRGYNPRGSESAAAPVVDTPICTYILQHYGAGFTGPLIRVVSKTPKGPDTSFKILLADTTNPMIDSVTKVQKRNRDGDPLYHLKLFDIANRFVKVEPIASH